MNSPSRNANDEVIYIFTTAGNTKPTYRRGILDLIAYPAGHILQFSYRRSDIHPEVNPSVPQGTGTKGVVIFVDTDPENVEVATYVPLRCVNIVKMDPPARSRDADEPEERVDLSLEIGGYIEYRRGNGFRQWHESLKVLDRIREQRGKGSRYFVVPGQNLFGPPQSSEHVGWERLVRAVSESSRFKDAIFLRLSHLTGFRRTRPEVQLKAYHHDGPRAYWLRPGQDYQLDFDIFINPSATPAQARAPRVTLTCSGEIVNATKPFQSVVSGLVQQYAILSCKRTIEQTGAALSVEIREPVRRVVNTPNPVFLLRIGMSRKMLGWFVALVFVGSLFVSSDKDALAVIFSAPDLWVWLAKIAGSVLLAWAAFLAFRKLPSGQG